LTFPASSAAFLKLLKRKVRGRSAKTQRFFGEAFVASRIPHAEAHYGSVKWLTNSRFAASQKLASRDHERLREALHKHFGEPCLQRLQRVATTLAKKCRKELAGKKPTAPDLWLVDKRGRHRFIEVKLPGDSAAPHQIAGMAAIASVLSRPGRVSVEIIQLTNDQQSFKAFCRAIREGKPAR
jgi:hypothetical protein